MRLKSSMRPPVLSNSLILSNSIQISTFSILRKRNFSNSLPEQKDWKRNTIHVIIAYLFIYSLKFTWSYSQIHNHLHSNPSFPPTFYGLLLLLITPPSHQSSLESKYFGVNLEKEKKPRACYTESSKSERER